MQTSELNPLIQKMLSLVQTERRLNEDDRAN
jgi:hypothetical protein